MGYIYKITNKINNKIYIGQTIKSVLSRFNDHIYEATVKADGCVYLNNAIRKFGKENFTVEIIEECDNKILNEREKFWIKKLKSHFSYNNGYNISWGGEGNIKITDEQILDLWNKGFLANEIAKKLNVTENTISVRLKKLKPGESKERYHASRKIPIEQYDLDGVFVCEWDSASDAARYYKIDDSGSITRCCKKERTASLGYFWKYKNDNTNIEEFMIAYAKSIQCKEVLQIDPATNKIIKKYESGAIAEKELSLPRGKVSEVCNHKRKTTGGYKWEWAYKTKRDLINEIN